MTRLSNSNLVWSQQSNKEKVRDVKGREPRVSGYEVGEALITESVEDR